MRELASAFLLVFLTGCMTFYQVPTVGTSTVLTLSKADFDIVDGARGEGRAAMIFPIWLFKPSIVAATEKAVAAATISAYEKAGADFLLQPKVKTYYYNFLLFDYAKSEASGKGAKIR